MAVGREEGEGCGDSEEEEEEEEVGKEVTKRKKCRGHTVCEVKVNEGGNGGEGGRGGEGRRRRENSEVKIKRAKALWSGQKEEVTWRKEVGGEISCVV